MRALPDLLVEIVDRRRERLGGAGLDRLGRLPSGRGEPFGQRRHPFLDAIGRPGVSIIAEVKLGSPRLGDLRARVDPEAQAVAYSEAGAAALSVVVEPDFFHGDYDVLRRCRRASGLPTLAKDFVVDPSQLEMAAAAGADAVLLIAALYEEDELVALAAAARGLGLAPLVETHSGRDVDLLATASWELVGVNNRDLRTFEVDIERSARLRPRLPAGALTVAESGLERRRQIERLAEAGYDAFLVGETLLLAEDPAARLRGLLKGRESGRSGRGGRA